MKVAFQFSATVFRAFYKTEFQGNFFAVKRATVWPNCSNGDSIETPVTVGATVPREISLNRVRNVYQHKGDPLLEAPDYRAVLNS